MSAYIRIPLFMCAIFLGLLIIPAQMKMAFVVALILLTLLLILKLGFVPAGLYRPMVSLRQKLPYNVTPTVYSPVCKNNAQTSGTKSEAKFKKKSKEELIARINNSLASEEVKSNLYGLLDKAEAAAAKDLPGLGTHNTPLFVFSGPSGVGKTSVARILGEIFHNVGAIPAPTICLFKKGELESNNPGAYIKSEISNYLGGIVVIDNADWLISPDDKLGTKYIGNVGQSLAEIAEDRTQDFMFVLTGSPKWMDQLLADPDNKPWLNSFLRFHFEFDHLANEKMADLVVTYLAERGWQIEDEATEFAERLIRTERESNDGFSNAHLAKQMVDNLILYKDSQVADQNNSIITLEDIEEVFDEFR